jgi:hypothetical protein
VALGADSPRGGGGVCVGLPAAACAVNRFSRLGAALVAGEVGDADLPVPLLLSATACGASERVLVDLKTAQPGRGSAPQSFFWAWTSSVTG